MMIVMIVGIILMVISGFIILYHIIDDSEYNSINLIFFIIGLCMFGYKFVIGNKYLPIVGNTYL